MQEYTAQRHSPTFLVLNEICSTVCRRFRSLSDTKRSPFSELLFQEQLGRLPSTYCSWQASIPLSESLQMCLPPLDLMVGCTIEDTALEGSKSLLLCTLQLASGGCFGMDQPLAFQLLDSKEESLDSLEGIAMELEDSLYPLLREVRWRQPGALTLPIPRCTTDVGMTPSSCALQIKIGNNPQKVFQDADWALLLGAVPRKKGK